MNECAPHTKAYVPGVLKRQEPAHPAADGFAGSGGTAPLLSPDVWVHEVGEAASKTTLWALKPSG